MLRFFIWMICACIGAFSFVHVHASPESSVQTEIARGTFSPQKYLSLRPILRLPAISEDANFLRFVDPYHALNDINYRPDDLVPLANIWQINQAGRSSLYRDSITEELTALAEAFRKEFGENLVAISAFRSAEYQQRLWDLGRCNSGAFCSKPGHSEHQLGLAFDFFDASNETMYMSNPRYRRFVAWFQAHAHEYGFTQSYQNGVLLDNYEVEPWHWRYVGKDMATHLHNLGWSYTQYIKFIDGVYQY